MQPSRDEQQPDANHCCSCNAQVAGQVVLEAGNDPASATPFSLPQRTFSRSIIIYNMLAAPPGDGAISLCMLFAALKQQTNMRGLSSLEGICEADHQGGRARGGDKERTPAKNGEVTRIIKALAEGDHEPGQQLRRPANAQIRWCHV